MRIAVLGAGSIGLHVGRLLARAGHQVVLSWSSSPQRLAEAAEAIGPAASTDTPRAAVGSADAVLFAPRFEHVDDLAAAVGGFGDRVVVDTTNPYKEARDGLVDLGEHNAAQWVGSRLAQARYVKGFNTLTAEFLTASAGRDGPDRVVLPLSGDDADAKVRAAGLVRDAGFEPVDAGTVADSGAQLPGGPYFGEELHLADVPTLRRL